MRNWLQRLDGSQEGDGKKDEQEPNQEQGQGQRVAVVHCKAGKGRSGTLACSYLISQEGWKMEEALQRFTERRMRVGFGSGVSIPSQMRWVRYVDKWTNELGKRYVERPVEILEIHVWGLRDGVKVAVEAFVEDGQKIKQFHLFHRNERVAMQDDTSQSNIGSSEEGDESSSSSNINPGESQRTTATNTTTKTSPTTISSPKQPLSSSATSAIESDSSPLPTPVSLPNKSQTLPTSHPSNNTTTTSNPSTPSKTQSQTQAVLLRPSRPLLLPSPDINIDFERRSKAASYTGLAMVTSIAHVWFNPYFEGGDAFDSGVFEVDWDAMDGIKGTSKKGIKALDRLKVVWRYAEPGVTAVRDVDENSRPVSRGVVREPGPGEIIPEVGVGGRDWRLRGVGGENQNGSGSGTDSDAEVKGVKSDGGADEAGNSGKRKENVRPENGQDKDKEEKGDDGS